MDARALPRLRSSLPSGAVGILFGEHGPGYGAGVSDGAGCANGTGTLLALIRSGSKRRPMPG